jgi:hypothetical protein
MHLPTASPRHYFSLRCLSEKNLKNSTAALGFWISFPFPFLKIISAVHLSRSRMLFKERQ